MQPARFESWTWTVLKSSMPPGRRIGNSRVQVPALASLAAWWPRRAARREGPFARAASVGNNMSRLIIRSGGQSGVDRAALVAASELGLDYCGWCPQGGWAEDFRTPPGVRRLFPDLKETPSTEPEQRTAWNVRDSDASLILTPDLSLTGFPGTRFTRICAGLVFVKPLWVAKLGGHPDAETMEWFAKTTDRSAPPCLNVAGPRESEAPAIFEAARRYLLILFKMIG